MKIVQEKMPNESRENPLISKIRVESYLENNVSDINDTLVDMLHCPELPIAKTIVFVPVLVTEDPAQIQKSLSLYASQEKCDPFTVLLYLNGPSPIDTASLGTALEAIEQAIIMHDDIDVRWTAAEYKDPKIGQIRNDAWDAGIGVALKDGLFDTTFTNDVVGINHDIDTESMSPHYIRSVQQHFLQKNNGSELLAPAFTYTSHYYPFESHPNTARGIFWADFTYRQARVGYEAGLVVPLEYFAMMGGFDDEARTHETKPLTEFVFPDSVLPAHMKTSSRRYIDRFPGYGYSEIWTDETFGPDDNCRKPNVKHLDATPEQLEQHMLNSMPQFADTLRYGAIRREYERLPQGDRDKLAIIRDGEAIKMFHDAVVRAVGYRCRIATRSLTAIYEDTGLQQVERAFEEKGKPDEDTLRNMTEKFLGF